MIFEVPSAKLLAFGFAGEQEGQNRCLLRQYSLQLVRIGAEVLGTMVDPMKRELRPLPMLLAPDKIH